MNEGLKTCLVRTARHFLEVRDVSRLGSGSDVSGWSVVAVSFWLPARLSDSTMTHNQRVHVLTHRAKLAQTHTVNSPPPHSPPPVWLPRPCFFFFFLRNEHNSSTKCNYAKVSWLYIRIPRSATEQISRGINHCVFSRVG